jgi:hypothetical protein
VRLPQVSSGMLWEREIAVKSAARGVLRRANEVYPAGLPRVELPIAPQSHP